MKTVWLFPGQGAQYPGMGREMCRRFETARRVFARAEALCGRQLDDVRMRGPAKQLRQCEVLEPVLAAVSLAYAMILQDHGHQPACVAGYSAGEVPALYCAGVLSWQDALRVAVVRGRILQAASDSQTRMVAVSRMPRATTAKIVRQLAPRGRIAVAGWNAHDHVTVVGDDSLVRHLEARVQATGAETSPIDVAGPWHCGRLQSEARQLREQLDDVSFSEPQVPIYASSTGSRQWDPERLKQCLADQISSPVQWDRTIGDLRARGIRSFYEVGPGRVLYGILRRAWPQTDEYSVRSMESRTGGLGPLRKILTRNCPLTV